MTAPATPVVQVPIIQTLSGGFVQGVTPTPFRQINEKSSPRALITIDGTPWVPKSYNLELNLHGSTDTATVLFPIKNYPDWTQVIARSDLGNNADKPVYVQIYAGYPSDLSTQSVSQLTLRFAGIVDDYTISRKNDETTFQCRSLAAPLTTNTITVGMKGGGNTTVAFVKAMAAKYNLRTQIDPSISPGTITDVLAQNFIAGVRNVNIWTLILQCAQYDDVDVWVDEFGVLWYWTPTGLARNKIPLAWGRDFLSLDITHSPQFSKNVVVEVRSWQKRVKTSTTYRTQTGSDGDGITALPTSRVVTSTPVFGTNQSVSTSVDSVGNQSTTLSAVVGGSSIGKSAAPASFSGKERYVFNVKNKTPQQCAELSAKYWRQISEHEFSAKMTLPMTKSVFANLHSTTELVLTTGFVQADGAYWPRRISEHFSPQQGWLLDIDAVNHEYANGAVNGQVN